MTSFIDSKKIPAAGQSRPENPEQVVEAINLAKARGLRLAVVTTGHGMNPLGSLVDSMVLDMSGFDSVEIDPVARRARVGAGVRWHQLVDAAAAYGLTAPFGSARTVGVVGYCLGGGIGPLGRKLGMGASAVVAAEVVTADGEIRRVDADNDPELLWALKGSGGGLAIVTALELELTPVETVTGGMIVFPFARATEVLADWARWTETAPAHLTSSFRIVQPAPGEVMVLVSVASPESEAEVMEAIEPLVDLDPVANMVKPVDPATFMAENTDPDDGPPIHIEHTLIDGLAPAVRASAIAAADPANGSMLMLSEFRHLGGAFAEPDADSVASHLDGNFTYMVMGPPEKRTEIAHAVDTVCDFGHGRSYLNFAYETEDPAAFFGEEAVTRLRAVYDRLDPEQFFHHAHPVERSREGVA